MNDDHPEALLTDIFAAFRIINRRDFEPDVTDAREVAREALLDLAQWIDKGGAAPKIMLDGSCLKRYPVDLR